MTRTGSSDWASQSSTKLAPMKPAPPVTKIIGIFRCVDGQPQPYRKADRPHPAWPVTGINAGIMRSFEPVGTTLPAAMDLLSRRVLVAGDVMLDRYWFGDCDRISPEAPVPVVRVSRTEERLGG